MVETACSHIRSSPSIMISISASWEREGRSAEVWPQCNLFLCCVCMICAHHFSHILPSLPLFYNRITMESSRLVSGLLRLTDALLVNILSFLTLSDKLLHLAPVSSRLPLPPDAFHFDSLLLTRDLLPTFLASNRLCRTLSGVCTVSFTATRVSDEGNEPLTEQVHSFFQLVVPPSPTSPSRFSRVQQLCIDITATGNSAPGLWLILSSLFPSPSSFPFLHTFSLTVEPRCVPTSSADALEPLSQLRALHILRLTCSLDSSGLVFLLSLPLNELDLTRCALQDESDMSVPRLFPTSESISALSLPNVKSDQLSVRNNLQLQLVRYFARAAEIASQPWEEGAGDQGLAQTAGRRRLRRLRLHCYGDFTALLQQAGRVSSLTEMDLHALTERDLDALEPGAQGRDDAAKYFLLAAAETPMSGLRTLTLVLRGVVHLNHAYSRFFTFPITHSLQRVCIASLEKLSGQSQSTLLQLVLSCTQLTALDASSGWVREPSTIIVTDLPRLPLLQTLYLDGVGFQPGGLLRLLTACPSLMDCQLKNSSFLDLDLLPSLGCRCPLLRRLHLVLDHYSEWGVRGPLYPEPEYDVVMPRVVESATRLQQLLQSDTTASSGSHFPCLSFLRIGWPVPNHEEQRNAMLDAALCSTLPALLVDAPLRWLSAPLTFRLDQLSLFAGFRRLQYLCLRACEASAELQSASDNLKKFTFAFYKDRLKHSSVDGAVKSDELMELEELLHGEPPYDNPARFYFQSPHTRVAFWQSVERRLWQVQGSWAGS